MTDATHQTVQLSKGRHRSPHEGVCVMELASMLAGEPFSDRPACVCPVIGGVLRSYNDAITGPMRQDLYAYAARIVGTKQSADVEIRRRARVLEWASVRRRRRLRLWTPAWLKGLAARSSARASVGQLVLRAVGNPTGGSHRDVLAMVDELIAMDVVSDARSPVGCDELVSDHSRYALPIA